jgi:hypothetical protein
MPIPKSMQDFVAGARDVAGAVDRIRDSMAGAADEAERLASISAGATGAALPDLGFREFSTSTGGGGGGGNSRTFDGQGEGGASSLRGTGGGGGGGRNRTLDAPLVSADGAAIVGELRGIRQSLSALVTGDGGARLRAMGGY